MKKLLLLALALVMVMSVTAYGQGGAIMLYSDLEGTSCEIAGNPGSTLFVYVYHSFTPGTTASSFRIQQNGTNFVYITDQAIAPTITIDNADVGGNYAYTQCVVGPHHFLNVIYSGIGLASTCATLQVVAKPTAAFIEGVDCDDVLLVADGSTLIVNSDGTCDCGRIVPVKDTNWGQIKSLYN
jgi:hypothetical protein